MPLSMCDVLTLELEVEGHQQGYLYPNRDQERLEGSGKTLTRLQIGIVLGSSAHHGRADIDGCDLAI
jgi:hypothetical protein